jgi:hypothetical protein
MVLALAAIAVVFAIALAVVAITFAIPTVSVTAIAWMEDDDFLGGTWFANYGEICAADDRQ